MKKEMLNWVFEIDVCCKAMEMQHIHQNVLCQLWINTDSKAILVQAADKLPQLPFPFVTSVGDDTTPSQSVV